MLSNTRDCRRDGQCRGNSIVWISAGFLQRKDVGLLQYATGIGN